MEMPEARSALSLKAAPFQGARFQAPPPGEVLPSTPRGRCADRSRPGNRIPPGQGLFIRLSNVGAAHRYPPADIHGLRQIAQAPIDRFALQARIGQTQFQFVPAL